MKKRQTFISHSEQATRQYAQKIAEKISKDLKNSAQKSFHIICLSGDLGSGKTIFAKGFAAGFGLDPKQIKSPTYTLVRHYQTEHHQFFHYDFYRLESIDELTKAELTELFNQKDHIFIIEWPERIQQILPAERLEIKFETIDTHTRHLHLHHHQP